MKQLKYILDWCNTKQRVLKMSQKEAVKKTLEDYNDFKDWLYKEKEFKQGEQIDDGI